MKPHTVRRIICIIKSIIRSVTCLLLRGHWLRRNTVRHKQLVNIFLTWSGLLCLFTQQRLFRRCCGKWGTRISLQPLCCFLFSSLNILSKSQVSGIRVCLGMTFFTRAAGLHVLRSSLSQSTLRAKKNKYLSQEGYPVYRATNSSQRTGHYNHFSFVLTSQFLTWESAEIVN